MRLEVWMEGQEVPLGVLARQEGGGLSFKYGPDPDVDLSLSMPRRKTSYGDVESRAFFANLLFEGPELARARGRYGLAVDDVAGLLFHVGADCPGALSITPEGAGPGKMPGRFPDDYEPVAADRLEVMATSLSRGGRLPDDERSPSPLAGYQGKIALLHRDGAFYLPRPDSGAPTTHILKVSPQAEPWTTRREAAMLDLARLAVIPTAEARTLTFGDGDDRVNAILLTRFDRMVTEDRVHRLHGEDLCQAIGLPPSLKYGYDGASDDRRFTAKRIGAVMRRMSVPVRAAQEMLDQTLFNMLVGNTDNHAKNTTIIRSRSGSLELAPLYDVVPVFMDPTVTHKLAFDIGSARYADDVRPADLVQLARGLGFSRPSEKRIEARMRRLVDTIQTWAEEKAGAPVADALSAQMGAVARATGFDLGVVPRGSYQRLARDHHHIEF